MVGDEAETVEISLLCRITTSEEVPAAGDA